MIRKLLRKLRVAAYIECGICKKKYRCKLLASPNDCAKKYRMYVLQYEDLAAQYSESIYVCEKCFKKYIQPFFNIDSD